MRNRMRNALSLLLAACVLFLCTAGAAQTMHEEIASDTLDMEISVGYDGAMTYGKPMPMRVRIRNFGDDFEGVLGMNAYIRSSCRPDRNGSLNWISRCMPARTPLPRSW